MYNNIKLFKKTKKKPFTLNAGDFKSWLFQVRNSFINNSGIEVSCGKCNGCCTSSQFININPMETKTLSYIPNKLLYTSPLFPKGNMVLGYDENGNCPMIVDGKCSIYENRPLACRKYDCRIFTASGLVPDSNLSSQIQRRVKLWRFSFVRPKDKLLHKAVKKTVKFILENVSCFPNGIIPNDSSQLAIIALKTYEVFLNYTELHKEKSINQSIANRIINTNNNFGHGYNNN